MFKLTYTTVMPAQHLNFDKSIALAKAYQGPTILYAPTLAMRPFDLFGNIIYGGTG
jgi:hypothetical protein